MAAPAQSAPATSPPTEFVRGIGPLAAISLVVGSMIGSGIFIVSADIGRQVSPWGPGGLLLVWVVTGLVTVVGALSYAELAAMMPKAGGQYVFLREGLSPSAGFLYGWTLFAVIQTGTIAAVAVAFARFLSVLVPAVSPDVFLPLGQLRLPGAAEAIQLGLSPQRVVAILSILLLTWINARGVRLGASIQTVFTVAKTGALAVLVICGLTLFRQPAVAAGNFADFWGTGDWTLAMIPLVGAAMVGSLFSSDAWNNVTFAAAEVQNPSRNLPIALAVGTGLVSLLYVLTNVAYLNVLPFYGDANGADALARGIQHASQDRVGTAAIEVALGGAAAAVMAVAILLSTFGCNNGLILAGPRVYWAMARDRLFFQRPPSRAPHPSVRPLGPGGLGLGALHQRHLRPAARLRHLRRPGLLLPHHPRALPPPAAPARPAATGQGLRLPGAAGAVPAGGRRPDADPAVRETALHLARAPHRGHRDPGVPGLAGPADGLGQTSQTRWASGPTVTHGRAGRARHWTSARRAAHAHTQARSRGGLRLDHAGGGRRTVGSLRRR
jgi:APA family basic amino acid/polyamine antiporter